MSIAAVQTAIVTHLKTLTSLPPMQEENVTFTPGTSWCRVTLLPARTQQVTLGLHGSDQLMGLAQCDLFVPVGSGVDAVNALADLVVAHFPRGTTLSTDTVTVHTHQVWRQTGGIGPQKFYGVPVVIEWST
jgi:hypothetical protein